MLCLFLLLFIVIEDRAAILGAYIIPLPVQGGRIMRFPEYFQQFIIGDNGRVISDLQGFRMAGCATANFFVGRMGHMSACITGDGFYDSFSLLDNGFRTPEHTGSKSPCI